MKFEYDPPSGPSKMIDHDTQDLKHKLRLASNNLVEGETEENLIDGEFYWRNNDPEVGQRTLYAKRAEGLVKLLTIVDNTVYYPGINEINLEDDAEVKGFLPLKKLSKGSITNNGDVSNFIIVDNTSNIKILSADQLGELLGLGDLALLDNIAINRVEGLGELAVLDTVGTNDIEDGAVTQAKLASSVAGNLPIGFIYFQLRGQSTPDMLFNTTGKWQDISSTYAGEFFRAVGGNSASFGSKQNEGLPNISGSFSNVGGAEFSSADGAFYPSGNSIGYGHDILGISQPKTIYFNASRSSSIYGASTHVTPYNSAVRIWKKIS